MFTHRCKTLTKLALKNVLTTYREAKEKNEKKKMLAGLLGFLVVGFFWVCFFFGRLYLKAAKLPSASERQTNTALRSQEEST